MATAQVDRNATKERILRAASDVFADYTFEKATVREICSRAEANVAAVNYHFRDKHELYSLILAEWQQASRTRFPFAGGLEDGMSPEQCLEALYSTMLRRIFFGSGLDTETEYKRLQVFMRELSSGRDSRLNSPKDEEYCEMVAYLTPVVKELLGDCGEVAVKDCVDSALGQVLSYFIGYVFEPDEYIAYRDEAEIARIAKHMSLFALNGIKAVKASLA